MLAVLHSTEMKPGNRYVSSFLPEHIGSKRLDSLEQALRENDLAVIQKDSDAVSLRRVGYVGVFRFKDLIFDTATGEFSLTLTEKYAEAKK